jgi:hypothetical protein
MTKGKRKMGSRRIDTSTLRGEGLGSDYDIRCIGEALLVCL